VGVTRLGLTDRGDRRTSLSRSHSEFARLKVALDSFWTRTRKVTQLAHTPKSIPPLSHGCSIVHSHAARMLGGIAFWGFSRFCTSAYRARHPAMIQL
jgi:hypothetical protein